ncbi:hypothetical protein UFOVP1387_31 [uncultured Caudovirales phage]|jgi:hypothetical protein|uniref:Uncharacterized protein n=1 Tax=uncultured Caudovirales phage TaxID=2100421 RepID=A0A6J5S649_9CAUD|nr:hypothetical protein UFOVP1387_31 [uncultured Caudovirales phage]
MAHFAEIDDNNIVISVIAVHNNELLVDGVESEQRGVAFCNSIKTARWIQTSYNANFRKSPAYVGGTYDDQRDEFVYPQPFPSWSLDDNNDWQPPVARPTADGQWIWEEETQQWQL